MTVSYKSGEVQQNFGLVSERAMTDTAVMVERYGAPKVTPEACLDAFREPAFQT